MPSRDITVAGLQKAAAPSTTRDRLIAAARPLFTEHGFEGVSNVELAKAAGVTTGAIFSTFSGKEALYRAAMDASPITAADCHALQKLLPRIAAALEVSTGASHADERSSLLLEIKQLMHRP